ncbi:MAG TPA: hypothetical protein VL306_02225 [Methylomirabilota bacterium]|nr:hypothetical protein [Methylomirabilota bacterium]
MKIEELESQVIAEVDALPGHLVGAFKFTLRDRILAHFSEYRASHNAHPLESKPEGYKDSGRTGSREFMRDGEIR